MESFRAFYAAYGAEMWLGLAVALVAAFAWLVVAQVRSLRASRRYRALTQGVDGANLEPALHRLVEQMERLREQAQALAQQQTRLEDQVTAETHRLDAQAHQMTQQLAQRFDHALHRVGVVRFNPFSDTGGDQSFAVALLDGHDDGVVFSGLHSRAGCRVYAKPVTGGTSTYNLSAEEQEAIQKARQA